MSPPLVLAQNPHVKTDRGIREELLRIEGGEREGAEAADKLRAAPRARAVAILREELLARSEPRSAVLRAVSLLEMRELWPEMKKLALKSTRWQTFSALNSFLKSEKDTNIRSEVVKIYLGRLDTVEAPAKMAILDGLAIEKVSLRPEVFRKLLEDTDFQVRIATIRHFLETRTELDLKEQVARFQTAFVMKPYQARLLAMRGFLALNEKERNALKEAVKPDLCKDESKNEVKAVCRKLAESRGVTK